MARVPISIPLTKSAIHLFVKEKGEKFMRFSPSLRRTMSNSRSYNDAIHCLNSLQTNAATLEAIRKSGGRSSERSLPEMRHHVERMGYKCSDFNAFNAIHVAGTKGKGSTSAFCESILRKYFESFDYSVSLNKASHGGFKTGLYTSPHLLEVRERIRIDGKPLSRDQFTKYFFECWDRLKITENNSESSNSTGQLQSSDGTNHGAHLSNMPTYFRFLTLMAYHVFIREQVQVGVVEVGIGGAYDATNILEKPVVCGISSLGFDHQALLGETLPEIAWHKCGIFKNGCSAVSIAQRPDAMEVVKQQAKKKNCRLSIVGENERQQITREIGGHNQLGLKGVHQLENAALAVQLCREWLTATGHTTDVKTPSLQEFSRGLREARWPGRAQIVKGDAGIDYYLDGAHTVESMSACAEWFREELAADSADGVNKLNYLIFNCTNGRRPERLLAPLLALPFHQVIFCTNQPFSSTATNTRADSVMPADLENRMVSSGEETTDRLAHQRDQEAVWLSLPASSGQTFICDSVDAALKFISSNDPAVNDGISEGDRMKSSRKVLITGSLHLVGAALTALKVSVV